MKKKIPLEDTFVDVLGKALRGRGLDTEALANRAGISTALVGSVLGGAFDEPGVRALAEVLGLQPDRIVTLAKNEYRAEEIEIPVGLSQFNTPFDDMTVNSYLVWDPSTKKAAAFDTGTDCDGILEAVVSHGLTLDAIYLTHSHGDHIYDLDRLKENSRVAAWIGEKEPVDGAQGFSPGKTFSIGRLAVETRSTWGHSPGGITYVITGLPRTIAIVGDAIFAGSMGGGNVSYDDALKTNRNNILSLPEETILCPGHGPLTTVGEQTRTNPFFPDVL